MRRAVAAVMIRERSRCFACQLHGRSDRIGHGARRRDIDSRYYYRTSGEIAVLAYVSFIVCPKPSACASETVRVARDLGFSRRYAYLTRFFKNPLGPRLRVAFAEPSFGSSQVRAVLGSWLPRPPARGPLYQLPRPTSARAVRAAHTCIICERSQFHALRPTRDTGAARFAIAAGGRIEIAAEGVRFRSGDSRDDA